MNQIGSKVYYVIETGEVLYITPEAMGVIIKNTKEEDYDFYNQLQEHPIDEIDYLELEFGVLGKTFHNAKSYKVNTVTKALEITYYTQEELEEMNKDMVQ